MDSVFAFAGGGAPGCAVAAARGGTPILARGYGMAELEHGARITPETVFETGSVAKQFTAFALLLLERDGRLSLDDDVRRHIPELPDLGPRITLRHMLTHTSGLREQWSLLAVAGNPPASQVHSPATVLDVARRQRGLNFAPGSEHLYTNTGYTLAALVVERASGRAFAQFTEERIFRPLGMARTRWRDDFRRLVPGRASAYSPAQGGFQEDMPFTNVVGNGGMLTTVGDLLRWNAFLDSPLALPGGAELVRALQAPGRLADGRTIPYALGLDLDSIAGAALVSHSGSTGGYRSWLGRVPSRGVSVAVLCNSSGVTPNRLGEQVTSLLLPPAPRAAAPAGPPPAPVPPAELARYAGVFWDSVTGIMLRTEVVDGGLVLQGGRPIPLAPLGGGRFRLPNGPELEFAPAAGAVPSVRLRDDGVVTRHARVAPADTSAGALAAYEGTYRSDELDVRITIARKDGALVMRQPFGVERRLLAVFPDGFTTPLRGTTTLVFSRDAAGRVTGLGVWATAARNLRFVRE